MLDMYFRLGNLPSLRFCPYCPVGGEIENLAFLYLENVFLRLFIPFVARSFTDVVDIMAHVQICHASKVANMTIRLTDAHFEALSADAHFDALAKS